MRRAPWARPPRLRGLPSAAPPCGGGGGGVLRPHPPCPPTLAWPSGAGLDAIDCSGGMEGAPVETPWERFHLKGTARHDRRPNSFRRLDSGSSSATHASDAPPGPRPPVEPAASFSDPSRTLLGPFLVGACQCGEDHPPAAVLRPGLSEAAPRDDEAPPQPLQEPSIAERPPRDHREITEREPLQEPSITAVVLPIVGALLLRWTRTLDQQRAAEARRRRIALEACAPPLARGPFQELSLR